MLNIILLNILIISTMLAVTTDVLSTVVSFPFKDLHLLARDMFTQFMPKSRTFP